MAPSILDRLTSLPVPRRLSERFRKISDDELESISLSLKSGFFGRESGFVGYTREYLETETGKRDLHEHLHGRLEHNRLTVIPWLDSMKPLRNSTVLEIGCGTGSSTVAIAEQGATVTGIDIDGRSLTTARTRCASYKLRADIREMNAVDVYEELPGPWDFVILFASLEHMSLTERLTVLRGTWKTLAPEGILCVIETPNRLWFYDSHTSLLPFFDWLPDELAFQYAKFSPRPTFARRFDELTPESMTDFVRWGRGVSYHEFDLAIGPGCMKVVDYLASFSRRRSLLRMAKWLIGSHRRSVMSLYRACPRLSLAFCEPYLNLALRAVSPVC